MLLHSLPREKSVLQFSLRQHRRWRGGRLLSLELGRNTYPRTSMWFKQAGWAYPCGEFFIPDDIEFESTKSKMNQVPLSSV